MSASWLERLQFTGGGRLPKVLQSEAAECGLACLAMVAGYHGRQTNLNALRREHAISLKGITLQTLMGIAHQQRFTTRALRLELAELAQLKTPALLHWDLNHFVVLKHVRGNRAVLHDPAVGERTLSLDEISKHFTGVALELTPAPGFERGDERRTLTLRQLWKETVGLQSFLTQLLLLSLLLQGIALITPFYVQLVVDEAVVRLDATFLSLLALGFLVVALLQTVFGWIRSWCVMYLGTLMSVQVQTNLLRHLLRLPLDYFHKRHIGDIVSRFGSMAAIQGLLTTGIVEAIVDGLLLAFTLVVLIAYQPVLTLLIVGLLLVYLLIRWLRYHALRDRSVENLIAAAANSSHFMETLRGMPTVKLFGLELERLGQWQNRVVDATNASIWISRLNLVFAAVQQVVSALAHIAIVYLGATLVMQQAFTVGMLMAFLSYQSQFLGAGSALIDKWIAWKLLDIHLDRLADIALTEPEEPAERPPVPVRTLRGSLELEGVSFRYSPTEPLLLDQISLDVAEGACIVIAGPSGAGKSTLLRLALGLEKPERGTVRFGGVDIARLGLTDYRRRIAAVTQEDRLLSGSVAENLTLFDAQPDHERMVECATLCGLHDAIMALPMNYHSLIGDMGDVLSAGERQRLMLARALYRRPQILFLDEATSNLDGALDERINAMLAQQRMTRIIVTHRESPLGYADRAYRLARGRLEALTDPPRLVRTN